MCVGSDGTFNFPILKFLQRTNDFVLKFEFLDVISEKYYFENNFYDVQDRKIYIQ